MLKGDATINGLIGQRVYMNEVPDDAAYPVILAHMYAPSPDTRALGNVRVMANMMYIIRAIAKGSSTISVEPIANRLDQIFEDNAGANIAGVIGASVREMPFFMSEEAKVGNSIQQFRHLGGIYRLTVQGV